MVRRKKASHLLLKIGSRVGFFMILANVLGPIGFKVFLVSSVVNSHIKGKKSVKITVYHFSYFQSEKEEFTKKQPNLFLSFDMKPVKKRKGLVK